MKTVIVYESMFGNTEQFARKIADGLAAGRRARSTLADVRQVQTGRPGRVRPPGHRGPHARLLPEPPVDARRRGPAGCRPVPRRRRRPRVAHDAGRRRSPSRRSRPRVAVFDTRVEKVRRLPGSAAKRAARVLRTQGFELLDRPTSFYVADLKGPAARWRARPCLRVGCATVPTGRRPSARGRLLRFRGVRGGRRRCGTRGRRTSRRTSRAEAPRARTSPVR